MNQRQTKMIAFAALQIVLAIIGSDSFAQSIKHPFPFHLPPRDSTVSQYLPQIEAPAGTHGALSLSPEGHILAKDGTRLRFFGTELNYTANFIQHTDARALAKRLSKLGFNAVRLVANDWWNWDDASFMTINDSTGAPDYYHSYHLNPVQFARFDSMLYEFKKAGIYTVLTLSSEHAFGYGEIHHADSLDPYSFFLRYMDPSVRELERKWVGTLLTHFNPLTGMRYTDDPSIAVAEITWQNAFYYYWSAGLLNFIDSNNTNGHGSNTVNYYMSKRFDTLYNIYLKNKYGTNGQLNAAWMGNPNPPSQNLMSDGSFEDATLQAWSYIAQNSAKALFPDADGGVDSLIYKKIKISGLSSNPMADDIYAANLSAHLGKDSLYELIFWAKLGYNPARPALLTRQIYLADYAQSSYASNVATYVTIDTTWKKYTFTFRATYPGLQEIRVYCGNAVGDVWLDAFTLKHKAELGLVLGESLDNYSIYRLTAANLAGFPLQRMRDEVDFLDSLQLSYYLPIQKLIKDTLQFKGLVNFTQLNYWHTLPDQYVSSFGDLTEGYVGWDYLQARTNVPYDSSHWQVSNISELHSTYAGNMGYYMPAATALGKAYFANVTVPIANQYDAEQLLLIPAYAAFQDWDGVFFTPFASWRTELFQDSIPSPFDTHTNSNAASIQPNTAMLALAPAASASFRKGLIAPAEVSQTVEHTADEVSLWPYVLSGRGPWGVEGYLDPNVITALQVRQKFNGIHKVAAQYAFVGDTATKMSDGTKILWDQTNGLLNVNTPMFNAAAGRYANDTIVLSKITLSRRDDSRDMFVLSYLSLDGLPLDSSVRSLMAISTRSQNSGLNWIDSLGYGANWGHSPMLMSAATVDLRFKSIKDSVLIYPLDSMGLRTGKVIVAKQNEVSGLFEARVDQSIDHSVWFDVEKKNRTSGVADENASSFFASLAPNPAVNITKLTLTLPRSLHVKVEVIDDLGRSVREVQFSGEAGSHTVALPIAQLASGHYVVRVTTPTGALSQSLNVIR